MEYRCRWSSSCWSCLRGGGRAPAHLDHSGDAADDHDGQHAEQQVGQAKREVEGRGALQERVDDGVANECLERED